MPVLHDILVAIRSDADIVSARQQGRSLAATIGFTATDATLIATAISELARNIVLYAGQGEVMMQGVETAQGKGIVICARDKGPGIRSIDDVLRDGYSTSGGLGLGLPGVRRLMDEFAIESELRQGTVVTVRKWLK
ncbi:MAG TPA: anti-sigma regulatory factor [Steroidobacteraceae bacterium]|jgi:serine/threonine-protein kinase RsbT|nr:anti-sigma regulatory factor [Steroidobacteraceae bacterium]